MLVLWEKNKKPIYLYMVGKGLVHKLQQGASEINSHPCECKCISFFLFQFFVGLGSILQSH